MPRRIHGRVPGWLIPGRRIAVSNHSLRASSDGTPSIPSYALRSESRSDTPRVAGPGRVLRSIFHADVGRLERPPPWPRRTHGRVRRWLHSSPAHCRFGPFPSGILRRPSFYSLLPPSLRITFRHATCRRTRPCSQVHLPGGRCPSRVSCASPPRIHGRLRTWLHSSRALAVSDQSPRASSAGPPSIPCYPSAPNHISTRHVSPALWLCPEAHLPAGLWPSRTTLAPRTDASSPYPQSSQLRVA